jgi:tRNA pseudouridine55 synthase
MRHGFLLVSKPKGPTSHDIVDTVRARLHERSVGHLGTLDPAAQGLMVLAVGAKSLKVVELFQGLSKEYDAFIRLGAVSTTYDAEGVIEPSLKKGWEPPEQAVIQRVVQDHFLGRIDQTPPAHSAVKIGGERAYRKARQGKNVAMPARKVEISACNVLQYAFPELALHIACSSGTYIRSIAHDLGQLLRCGAYLESLVRTRVGDWRLADAVSPEKATWTDVLPLKDVLSTLPSIELTDLQMEDARCGRPVGLCIARESIGWHAGLPACILAPVQNAQSSHARKVF